MNRRMGLVVCGAGPAGQIGKLVEQAIARQWSVRLILTPAARGFVDEKKLQEQTGEPVRSAHLGPGHPRSGPIDLFAVAPASANTINKLALGIADTYALDVLTEAVGAGQPVVILPFVNTALTGRAPFRRNVDSLREEGVRVLLGAGEFEPHAPRTGTGRFDTYPWHLVLDAADHIVPAR